jgi:hypothetical protein
MRQKKSLSMIRREECRLHQYHFDFGLTPSLFDHVVVASVTPYVECGAGPDWIMCKEEEIAACRIVVGRDPRSLHRTIHVEAMVADTANEEQVEMLWESFELLCQAFVKVLRTNPGLRSSSYAWNGKKSKISMKRLLGKRPKTRHRESGCRRPTRGTCSWDSWWRNERS